MSDFQKIDVSAWERAEHCVFFRDHLQPQYGIGFDVDVTDFHKFVKDSGLSFTLAFVFAVTKCAGGIENFRYRFAGDDVVLYDKIDVSFTYLDAKTKLFKVVNAAMTDDMTDFVRRAKANAEQQRENFAVPPPNAFFFTSIPWISFTHFTHTISGRPNNGSALFDFGKFSKREGRLIMPFSAVVHHSFVDGYHVGLLAEKLQKYLNGFKAVI